MTVAPPRQPRLSTNVRWTLLGTASSAAGSWLLVIILARASGAAAVGAYAFALALTAPVMSFAGLQLRSLLASDPVRTYGFREYRKLTCLTAAVGVLACLLIAAVVRGGAAAWHVLVPVCAMRASDAVTEIYRGLWQQRERMRVIGVGRLLQLVVSVALVATISWQGGGVGGVAIGAALGSFTLLAYMHALTARDRDLRLELAREVGGATWSRLGRLALQGLPLGVILLLGELQANVPRYFIERDAGAAALGLFAAAIQLTGSGQLFVGALGSAALPRLAAWHASGNAAFGTLARKLALGGLGLGAAGVLASALIGKAVLELVYKPEFGAAADLLVVLSVAAGLGFVGSLLGYALTAARVIAVQPVILVVTLGVIVACCAALSSRYGAIGVAWALVAGSAVQAVASQVALQRSRTGNAP
jgi:O-antigen/teichoic acid export membrane protein